MIKSLTLALVASLALVGSMRPALAAADSALAPTVLETVVVTPTARYTASEWQARVAQRQAVVLDRVIVTPAARYTLAEWQQRQAGLATVKNDTRRSRMQRWLKMVWKHFQFARTPVEV